MKISLSSDIGKHLSLMVAISLLGMIVLLYVVFDIFGRIYLEEKRNDSLQLTNTAISIVHSFHELHRRGELSAEQARQFTLDTLRNTRYSDSGYFWINDLQGNIIMHPLLPELEGRNLINFRDTQGVKPFDQFIREAINGGGWVEYWWPKPEQPETPTHKVSYVSLYEPWQWVIGTGVYLDEESAAKNRMVLSSTHILLALVSILIGISLFSARHSARGIANFAIRDPLTQLYSRRYLNETEDRFVRADLRSQNKHLYVLFLDIDHFKAVNDTYGHLEGDQVLKKVGSILRESTRPQDLCVRYGGEEFIVLTLAEEDQAALQLAERLRRKAYFSDFSSGIEITLSCGIAKRREDESFANLLHRADKNLYAAKKKGRDQIVFKEHP